MTRLALALSLLSAAAGARAEEFALRTGTVDLPGVFEPAPGFAAEKAPRVVVLIHGSGPNDRDEDLSEVSAPGKPCVFFRDLSRALLKGGLSVVRYDKRSYVYKKRIEKDPKAADSLAFKAYSETPLSTTMADVDRAVEWARQRAPNARVYLLGHSQGAGVALQIAHRDAGIKGVALVGLPVEPTQTLVFEQTVYRPLALFESLDEDHDGKLSPAELAGDDPLKAALRAQLPLIDRDRDGSVSKAEFMGGNLSNLLVGKPLVPPAAAVEEARLPGVGEVLAKGRFPVSIFVGELDNQTPLYQSYAVDVANAAVWKRKDLTLRVFKGLGHALDPRDGPSDLVFRTSDPAALAALAADLAAAWK